MRKQVESTFTDSDAHARRKTTSIVIFCADDFGLCGAVNRAVMRAHLQGVLTSASLMVGAPAARQAVRLAREASSLAVGLHLVVAGGRPVLPPRLLRHVVDADGRLPESPLAAGLLYAGSAAARQELLDEVRAQFDVFAATGLPLSHVDGHMHMHVHPAIFEQVAALAQEFGAHGIRLPREPMRAAMAGGTRGLLARASRVAALGAVAGRCARCACERGLAITQRTCGVAHCGCMDIACVTRMLSRLHARSAELIFHPTEGPRLEALGPNPGDLATLLSPVIRRLIERRGICPGTYRLLNSRARV